MTTTWYSDEYAKRVHREMQVALKPIIERICRDYELSHMGINRNQDTGEVVLKLHLNPIGRVQVNPDMEGNIFGRLR